MPKKDYTGRTYGILHVKEWDDEKQAWMCKCECGNTKYYTSKQLQDNQVKSCGCLNHPNIIGKRYGRLVVMSDTGYNDANGNRKYDCLCDCGNHKIVTAHDLKCGAVRSCGCMLSESGKRLGDKYSPKYVEKYCVEGTNVTSFSERIRSNNTSGHKGVSWVEKRKKWVAQIGFKGTNYYLGRYDKIEDAIEAREKAEREIFGEFLKYYNETYRSEK